LLVVIAIIAVLMAIIMPSLNRAREMGRRAVCLNNTKTLALAWTLYASENDGIIPRSQGTADKGWVRAQSGAYATTPIEAPIDLQIDAIRKGDLYPLARVEKAYRCPVAARNEMRTYSASPAMNGYAADEKLIVRNYNKLKHLSTRLVFIDDHGENWDAMWYIVHNEPRWWNPVPMRHGKGTVVSFADAHSEFHPWKDERTIECAQMTWKQAEDSRTSRPAQPGNEDLRWIQTAIWGKLGYVFE
jgi:type II secretory pathway pseudopilin PulG